MNVLINDYLDLNPIDANEPWATVDDLVTNLTSQNNDLTESQIGFLLGLTLSPAATIRFTAYLMPVFAEIAAYRLIVSARKSKPEISDVYHRAETTERHYTYRDIGFTITSCLYNETAKHAGLKDEYFCTVRGHEFSARTFIGAYSTAKGWISSMMHEFCR